MTFPVNLTLTCYYFETAPGYVLSTNMAEGLMTFPLNLTMTCYYFETLLWPRDVNIPRLCYVNKDGGVVNDLPS